MILLVLGISKDSIGCIQGFVSSASSAPLLSAMLLTDNDFHDTGWSCRTRTINVQPAYIRSFLRTKF